MTKQTEHTYIIPAHLLVAIEYGDYTGLTDHDEQKLNEFLENLPQGNRCLSYDLREPEWYRENDVLGLGYCECIEATLHMF